MEAALDEERLAVLELMEGMNKARQHRGSTSSTGSGPTDRSSSPYNAARSPVRSMLDIAEDSVPHHASIAGTSASGISQPSTPYRSMLDIGPSPAQTSQIAKTLSAQSSPADIIHTSSAGPHTRRLSDVHPSDRAYRGLSGRPKGGDITDGYQFSGYLQSNPGGPIAPKRNTLAGKMPSAMAEAVRGELTGRAGLNTRDRAKGGSNGGNKSRSPHNRLGARSNSPSTGSSSQYNKLIMDNGLTVDKDSAYRRLSDANIALHGGSLSELPGKARRRTDSDDKRDQRLQKDYTFTGVEDAVESSDEESTGDEGPRGRKKAHRGQDEERHTTVGMGRAQGPRTAQSLMAAAEEERQMIANQEQSKYKVKSLLEPEITLTGPSGERLKATKPGVHPSNAFDQSASGLNTPHDSDTEQEISDIRRAQKLAILLTPITTTTETQRSVRTMFRGDFTKMQNEAEDDQRRVRKYLVATDLSEEATHALEWTVGTVLRDGDTLLAIYCVDEETGITYEGGTASDDATPSMEKQAASIAASTKALPAALANLTTMSTHIPSPLGGTPRTGMSASPATRDRPRAEHERHRAVEDITDRVSKLLRKTKLQVRVVIEVIHCKSPKHLICEVIDYFNPTLVILGSRGRSALKGVILGSFSNYLVTKSSVPVMVARKRLRKHTKYKRPSVRLANNLTGVSGKTLASAKID